MPTLPSTQTQSANGVPLYVLTDGDDNAVVQGDVLIQPQAYGTGRGVVFEALPGATISTGAGVVYNGNELLLSNNGKNIEMGVDGSLSVGRGLVAPTGTAGKVIAYEGILTSPTTAPITVPVSYNGDYVGFPILAATIDYTPLVAAGFKSLQIEVPQQNFASIGGTGTPNNPFNVQLLNGAFDPLVVAASQQTELVQATAVIACPKFGVNAIVQNANTAYSWFLNPNQSTTKVSVYPLAINSVDSKVYVYVNFANQETGGLVQIGGSITIRGMV